MDEVKQSFDEILFLARNANQTDENGEAYNELLWRLAQRGDQATLDKLLSLIHGDNFERKFSVEVLGRFAYRDLLREDFTFDLEALEADSERFASAQIIEVLLNLLESETDEAVMAEIVNSLGQHQERDERIPFALQRFLNHPNADIRWYLAIGMGRYETPEAADMLIKLSADTETRVRDWATFGLGSLMELDTPQIRAALHARLQDEDDDTRIEAIEGLTLRGDPRAVPAILREFDDRIEPLQKYLPSDRLLEALNELLEKGDYEGDQDEVRGAIAFCERILKVNQEQ